ncbi:MAG: hypothetical protein V2A54_06385 [Bacteroidota bacterium]
MKSKEILNVFSFSVLLRAFRYTRWRYINPTFSLDIILVPHTSHVARRRNRRANSTFSFHRQKKRWSPKKV